MYQRIIILFAVATAAWSAVAGSLRIYGQLTGLATDTLEVTHFRFSTNDFADQEDNRQTVITKDGSFDVVIPIDQLCYASVRGKVRSASGSVSSPYVMVIAKPGEECRIDGELLMPTISGTQFYQQFGGARKVVNDYYKVAIPVFDQMDKMQAEGVPRDSIIAYLNDQHLGELLEGAISNYAARHGDEAGAIMLLEHTNVDKIREMSNRFSAEVQAAMQPYIAYRQQRADEIAAYEQQHKAIREGIEAPDFTVKDSQGRDFTLSSLRGRYVVLDFWGSWCHWCIKGFPDMKEAYAKHRDRVEFIGVDCMDREDKWKEALAKHQLPWPQVKSEKDNDVAVLYGVGGYPTKIVISPDGIILKIVSGESPDFYTYLDELFSK